MRVWIIEQALVGFIDQEEEPWRLSLEALVDVDSGRLVAHEVVQAWAESHDKDNPVPLACRGREGPTDQQSPPSVDPA